MTHTVVELAISKEAHTEIANKLLAAGYDHCVIATRDGIMLNMTGIGVVAEKEPVKKRNLQDVLKNWNSNETP